MLGLLGRSRDNAKLRSPDLRRPQVSTRNRGGGRRRRIPLFLLLATTAFVLVLWHHLSEPSAPAPTSARSRAIPTTSKRLREKLSLRGRTRRKGGSCLIPSAQAPFVLPDHLLPVHHDASLMIYSNSPVAPTRPPSNQFLLDPRADLSSPVVAIITATNNPRPVLVDTGTTLLGQSLQNFVWVVVNDHTDEPAALELLEQVAKDPRVVVIQNGGAKGLAAGRNVGLEYVFRQYSPPPKYLVSLDDDDLFEYTALEKACWMLESNPDWDLGGFRYVKWGASNETVLTGVHSNSDNFLVGNFVPNAAVYTSRAVLGSGCRYDEIEFQDGGEDWDFWMCLAEHGYWGGSLLEPLYWYRVNSPKFRSQRWGKTFVDGFGALKRHIQTKQARLEGNFPSKTPARNVPLAPVSWNPPFEQALAHTDKQILFVIPWLWMGGADIGALHMIQLYAAAGYRVTVACTLNQHPESVELRPYVLQYTHDVHILPSFLHVHDFPRYIKHLVRSRGIRQVLVSHSQLLYELLPALVEQMPDVEWIDYLHNESYDNWKSAGYPRYSIISQRYLARTITCSYHLKDWLLDNGHLDPERIGVVKLGIETSKFVPATPAQRSAAKTELLQVEPETLVITVVGRLDPQKRPLLVPRIAEQLLKRIDHDFVIIMIGNGEHREQLFEMIETLDMQEYVKVLGTQSDPSRYYAASDIFLLPSISEGISIAINEAMAMGLPVVTARAGALPEQLGELDTHGRKMHGPSELGGILVDHELDEINDPVAYAAALESLIVDPALRARLARNARKLVETGSDWRTTLAGLFDELKLASNLPNFGDGDPRYPHPSAYYATEVLLAESYKLVDMGSQSRDTTWTTQAVERPHLPPELLLDILSTSSRSTLLASSLVCRGWRAVAQVLLENHLSLPTKQVARAYLSCPARRSKTRSLTVGAGLSIDEYLDLFDCCEGIEELVLLPDRSHQRAKFDLRAFKTPALKGLRSLHLAGAAFEDLAPGVGWSLPFSLNYLTCKGTYSALPRPILAAIVASSRSTLHTLDLDCYGSHTSARAFASCFGPIASTLRSLELHGSAERQVAPFLPFLSSCPDLVLFTCWEANLAVLSALPPSVEQVSIAKNYIFHSDVPYEQLLLESGVLSTVKRVRFTGISQATLRAQFGAEDLLQECARLGVEVDFGVQPSRLAGSYGWPKFGGAKMIPGH